MAATEAFSDEWMRALALDILGSDTRFKWWVTDDALMLQADRGRLRVGGRILMVAIAGSPEPEVRALVRNNLLRMAATLVRGEVLGSLLQGAMGKSWRGWDYGTTPEGLETTRAAWAAGVVNPSNLTEKPSFTIAAKDAKVAKSASSTITWVASEQANPDMVYVSDATPVKPEDVQRAIEEQLRKMQAEENAARYGDYDVTQVNVATGERRFVPAAEPSPGGEPLEVPAMGASVWGEVEDADRPEPPKVDLWTVTMERVGGGLYEDTYQAVVRDAAGYDVSRFSTVAEGLAFVAKLGKASEERPWPWTVVERADTAMFQVRDGAGGLVTEFAVRDEARAYVSLESNRRAMASRAFAMRPDMNPATWRVFGDARAGYEVTTATGELLQRFETEVLAQRYVGLAKVAWAEEQRAERAATGALEGRGPVELDGEDLAAALRRSS